MKRKLNKRKVLYFILMVIDIILICSIHILIYCHVDMNKRRRDSFVSSYNESSSIGYVVNMLENDYMTKDEFGNSNSYILKYTDNILFNFLYDYNSSNDINTNASYKIVANVSGSYKKSTSDSNEIYNKAFILDKGEVNSINNAIHLVKDVSVDINSYNDILKKLQSDIKLPLVGVLNVSLVVDTKDDNGKVIDNYKHNASVTLLSDIFEVNIDNIEPKVESFYSDDLSINYLYLVCLGIVFVILVSSFMILIRLFLQKKISKGESLVKKYLKTYDDFIVNVDDMVNEKKYEVVKILEFKELLTLANNNSTSILFYEQKKKGIFYVIIDNYLYKFEVDYEGE